MLSYLTLAPLSLSLSLARARARVCVCVCDSSIICLFKMMLYVTVNNSCTLWLNQLSALAICIVKDTPQYCQRGTPQRTFALTPSHYVKSLV